MASEWEVHQSDTRSNVKRVLPPSASVKLTERSSCGHLESTKTPLNQHFGSLIFNPDWRLVAKQGVVRGRLMAPRARKGKIATQRNPGPALKMDARSARVEQRAVQMVKCLEQRLELFSCTTA